MPALGSSNITRRYILALGPVKAEYVEFTNVTDGDTYASLIQRPTNGVLIPNTGGHASNNATVSISGKTVTLSQTGLSAGSGVLLLFGF